MVKSKASWGVPGSRTGSSAKAPRQRESCSLPEKMLPGTSPTATTMPPREPSMFITIRLSKATLRPAIFCTLSERPPEMDTPKAVSRAMRSLPDHSTRVADGSAMFFKVLMIEVQGRPGYPVARSTPTHLAAQAMASLPVSSNSCICPTPSA